MTASTTANDKEKESLGRLYPLCASGWCLARLRAVCEWWRFVRTGMIDVIWRGEDGWTRPERPSTLQGLGRNRSSIAPSEGTSAPPTPKAATSETMQQAADTEPPAKEEDKPELPPRKKSGWGLGFGSLGTGKGLGLSRGNTPPQSPSTESQSRLGDAPVVEEQAKVEVVTEPAVPALEELKDVETIVKAEDSTTSETKQVEAAEPGIAGEDQLAVPKTADLGADSDAEDGGNDFATPKSSNSALPTEDKADKIDEVADGDKETKDDAKTEGEPAEVQTVDISSPPRQSMDIATSGRPSMEAPTVPPTPARRRVVPPPPGTSAAPPLPERNQARPLSTATLAADNLAVDTGSAVKSPILPVTPDMYLQATGQSITPEPPVPSSTSITPMAGPPKLPNRASMIPGTSAPSKDGKRYVEGDSWEAKTWREVVRLKEDMWKARVGLVEAED